MASKRKYNPNKIQQMIRTNASQVHDLEMSYNNDVVDLITAHWLKSNPSEDVPTNLLYPHIKGDLIIAIKHRLIDMCQKWKIKMLFHIRNNETGVNEEVEIYFDLPRSHMKDIKSGDADFKIDRGSGIKTRWRGLDKEIEEALKPLENEGFECIKTIAHIKVSAVFKSPADYSYFKQEKVLRLTLGEMVG